MRHLARVMLEQSDRHIVGNADVEVLSVEASRM
jgi:hypothetical protein